MEERKFIRLKKEEFGIKEYIKRDLGKGKISGLDIEYTPVGEKIIISTNRPGLVIGKKGEKIEFLTRVLKKRFKLENPHIEINEITDPLFDAQLVADEIAMALERMGNLKFKVIAYRKLQDIMKAGALGCELRLGGKLPSERAKSWRFAEGYLKKAGESKNEIDWAQATALTKTGIIGIKVAIMPPTARLYDQIIIDDNVRAKIRGLGREVVEEVETEKKDVKKKKTKKEKVEKKGEEEIVKEEVKKVKAHKETKKEAEMEIAKEISEEIEEVENVKKDVSDIQEKGELLDSEGDAIAIEQEIEEGVSEEDIEDIEKVEDDEKTNKEENVNSEVKE